MGNTNWNLYKSFVAVYETKNKHRACELLGITRSAVIQNIKELEKQLDVTLFISHSRGVEPTEHASNLYPHVKAAIQTLVAAETSLRPLNTGAIKLAITSSSAEIILKAYLKDFYMKHPDIKLEILKFEGLDIAKQKQLDFIIGAESEINKTIYKTIDLLAITGAFVASKEFVKRNNLPKTISKDDLLRLPIICREETWKSFLETNNFDTKPDIIKSASTDMTYSMAKDSIGVAFFNREVLQKLSDNNLVEINVTGVNQASTKIVCGYGKPLSRSAQIFVEGFINFCKD